MLPYECHAKKNESTIGKTAKEIVMEYLQACERRDFKSARTYVSDNVSYMSPVGSIDRTDHTSNFLNT